MDILFKSNFTLTEKLLSEYSVAFTTKCNKLFSLLCLFISLLGLTFSKSNLRNKFIFAYCVLFSIYMLFFLPKIQAKKMYKQYLSLNNYEQIQSIYDESECIYDAPKIHKFISKKFDISLKRVQRFIKELGLRSTTIKKFKHHTIKVDIVEKDNVSDRDFSTTTINEKWVGDITYIHTIKDGW